MAYTDAFNLKTTNVSFNNVANAIDGALTRVWGGTTTGTATAYACSPSPSFAAYSAGDILIITPHTTNTGSATINVSGLGVRTIKYCNQDLVGGEMVVNAEVAMVYDAAGFFNILDHGGAWAVWTPTYTTVVGTFTSVTTTEAVYQRHGNTVFFAVRAVGTTSSSTADLRFSVPVTAANTAHAGGGTLYDGVTDYAAYWTFVSTSVISVRTYITGTITAGANRQFAVTGFYRC